MMVSLSVYTVKLRADPRPALWTLITGCVGTDLPHTAAVKAFSLHSHHLSYQVWHPPSSLIKLCLYTFGLQHWLSHEHNKVWKLLPYKIFVLSIFHTHTTQTILVLSAAGPVLPSGLVLPSLSLFGWQSKQLLSLSQQSFGGCHHTAKPCHSWSQRHEKHLPGAHISSSLCCGMLGITVLSSLHSEFVILHKSLVFPHALFSPKGEIQSLLIKQKFITLNHFAPLIFPLWWTLWTQVHSQAQGQKTAIISVPNQCPYRLAPNLKGYIHDLQQWQPPHEWAVSLKKNLQSFTGFQHSADLKVLLSSRQTCD